MTGEAAYFVNHDRRGRFPWSLYHGDLASKIARAVGDHGARPRVLVVGCGLEPSIEGCPRGAEVFACDLDARAIEACARRDPSLAPRLAVCPSPYELPTDPGFDRPFDVVVAKEVIEHLERPEAWARAVAAVVGEGGELVLTTPNYGRWSTLPLLESTVLEWVARRDGYSRADIHPSKFDERRLRALDAGAGMRLVSVEKSFAAWALVGRWRRAVPR